MGMRISQLHFTMIDDSWQPWQPCLLCLVCWRNSIHAALRRKTLTISSTSETRKPIFKFTWRFWLFWKHFGSVLRKTLSIGEVDPPPGINRCSNAQEWQVHKFLAGKRHAAVAAVIMQQAHVSKNPKGGSILYDGLMRGSSEPFYSSHVYDWDSRT